MPAGGSGALAGSGVGGALTGGGVSTGCRSRTVEHRFGLAARFLTSQRDGCGWCCGCGGRGGGSSGSSTLLCKQLGERAHANAVRHARHRRSSANRTRDRRFLPPLHTVCGGDPQEQHDHAVRHAESTRLLRLLLPQGRLAFRAAFCWTRPRRSTRACTAAPSTAQSHSQSAFARSLNDGGGEDVPAVLGG